MSEHCMLGLFEHLHNGRIQLYFGVGWNENSPVPTLHGPQDNRGYGVAGPYGIAYSYAGTTIYGRQLTRPFLARYQTRTGKRNWGGRHRTELYDPFRQNYTHQPRHAARQR